VVKARKEEGFMLCSLMSKNISMTKLIRSCLVETSNILFLSLIIHNEIPKLQGYIFLFWKDILCILNPNSIIDSVLHQNIKLKIDDGLWIKKEWRTSVC
jgi:hypothetical protein